MQSSALMGRAIPFAAPPADSFLARCARLCELILISFISTVSAHAKQNIHRQLIETLIRQTLASQFISVECQRLDSVGLVAGVTAEWLGIFRGCRMDLCQQCLDFRIFIKPLRLVLENQIIPHTAGGEFPNSGFIFTAVGFWLIVVAGHLMFSISTGQTSGTSASLDHCIERVLWVARPIEQQRVISSSFDGPVVQPRVPISDAPKSNSVDRGAVFQVNPEKIRVTLSQRLLRCVRQAFGV